jgi:hypothetical protein
MPIGPGKYDDVATFVRKTTKAKAIGVIVLGGDKGSGFSIQSEDAALVAAIPTLLRKVADEIERSK